MAPLGQLPKEEDGETEREEKQSLIGRDWNLGARGMAEGEVGKKLALNYTNVTQTSPSRQVEGSGSRGLRGGGQELIRNSSLCAETSFHVLCWQRCAEVCSPREHL